jgi:hypothetical protein
MTYTKQQIAAVLAAYALLDMSTLKQDGEVVFDSDDDEVFSVNARYLSANEQVQVTRAIYITPAIVRQQHARIAALEAALSAIRDYTLSDMVFLSAAANEAHFERLHTIARDALGGDA